VPERNSSPADNGRPGTIRPGNTSPDSGSVGAMKALSFKQPWAWAVFNGKDVDNRKWRTNFTGRIYVHSSLNFDMDGWNWIAENENRLCVQLPHFADIEYFPRGVILGEVDIVGCVDNHTSYWFFGKYGLLLQNPKVYENPIPCKGMLGFFRPVLATTNREKGMK